MSSLSTNNITFYDLLEQAYYQASVKLLGTTDCVPYAVVRQLEILASMRVRVLQESINIEILAHRDKTLDQLLDRIGTHVTSSRQLAQLRTEAAQLAVLKTNPHIQKLVLHYGTHVK
jgi:hypothetical protein